MTTSARHQIVLHAQRHSGPTIDRARSDRTVEEIRKRLAQCRYVSRYERPRGCQTSRNAVLGRQHLSEASGLPRGKRNAHGSSQHNLRSLLERGMPDGAPSAKRARNLFSVACAVTLEWANIEDVLWLLPSPTRACVCSRHQRVRDDLLDRELSRVVHEKVIQEKERIYAAKGGCMWHVRLPKLSVRLAKCGPFLHRQLFPRSHVEATSNLSVRLHRKRGPRHF